MKAIHAFLSSTLIVFFVAPGHAAVPPDPLDAWQLVYQGTGSPISFRGIAYQNGTFVAAGFGQSIVVSTNGANWGTVTNGLLQYEGLLAVAAGAGRFVATGGPLGAILSSSDGFQWTRHLTITNAEFWAVTHAGGKFVAIGFTNGSSGFRSISATSEDGMNWQVFTSSINTTPRNIAYGNGVYVAVGSPVSIRSSNGQQWTPIPTLLAQGIAFDGNRFVATLNVDGATSVNGTEWTPLALPQLTVQAVDQNYYTAAAANNLVLAAGSAGANGLVAISRNGSNFALIPAAVSARMSAIRDAVFVDGFWYLADQSGKIWRSGQVLPASAPLVTNIARSSNKTRLKLTVPTGFHYSLQSATRLAPPDWRACTGSLFSEAAASDVVVPDASPGSAAQFFRIVME